MLRLHTRLRRHRYPPQDLSRNVLPLLDVFAGLGFAAPEARGRMLLKYPNTLLTGVQDVKVRAGHAGRAAPGLRARAPHRPPPHQTLRRRLQERVAWLGSSVGGQLSPGDVSGILQRYVQIGAPRTMPAGVAAAFAVPASLLPVRSFIPGSAPACPQSATPPPSTQP